MEAPPSRRTRARCAASQEAPPSHRTRARCAASRATTTASDSDAPPSSSSTADFWKQANDALKPRPMKGAVWTDEENILFCNCCVAMIEAGEMGKREPSLKGDMLENFCERFNSSSEERQRREPKQFLKKFEKLKELYDKYHEHSALGNERRLRMKTKDATKDLKDLVHFPPKYYDLLHKIFEKPENLNPINNIQDRDDWFEKYKNQSTKYLDYFTLTPEDCEAIKFIQDSYQYAEVVDIEGNLLRVLQLRPFVYGCCVKDDLINAYAHIAASEEKNNNKGFITTFEAQKLSQDNGELDDKRRSWVINVGKKCLEKELIFIPVFNKQKYDWSLLVLNKKEEGGEFQILSPLPGLRNETVEKTLVKSLQKCIDEAVKDGQSTVDLSQWEIKDYSTHIPQQSDMTSSGVYMIKYMLGWDGSKMDQNFTQDDMNVFRLKICCSLLRSKHNKIQRASYDVPIMKKAYLATSQKDDCDDNDDDDDLQMADNLTDLMTNN